MIIPEMTIGVIPKLHEGTAVRCQDEDRDLRVGRHNAIEGYL